jgi:hypothetical protein
MMIQPLQNWEDHWADARPALERVCFNRQVDMKVSDIYWLLYTGLGELIKLEGGWAVVRPEYNGLHVVAVSGSALPPGWAAPFTHWLKDTAKAFGVPRATLSGRKGWRRALKHLGWVPTENGMEVLWAV